MDANDSAPRDTATSPRPSPHSEEGVLPRFSMDMAMSDIGARRSEIGVRSQERRRRLDHPMNAIRAAIPATLPASRRRVEAISPEMSDPESPISVRISARAGAFGL